MLWIMVYYIYMHVISIFGISLLLSVLTNMCLPTKLTEKSNPPRAKHGFVTSNNEKKCYKFI
jgi:hypothetical protein